MKKKPRRSQNKKFRIEYSNRSVVVYTLSPWGVGLVLLSGNELQKVYKNIARLYTSNLLYPYCEGQRDIARTQKKLPPHGIMAASVSCQADAKERWSYGMMGSPERTTTMARAKKIKRRKKPV